MADFFDSSVGVWGLFVSAFISATIAPGGSEVVLAVLLFQANHSPFWLVCVATLGNVLGAQTTWVLGALANKGYSVEKLSRHTRADTIQRVKKWGLPALLFAWLPVVGDAICFAAGWLGLSFFRCTIAITIGKFLRYALIAALVT